MRIALLNYAFPVASETFIAEKAARLAASGHDVTLFVRKKNAATCKSLPKSLRIVELYRFDWSPIRKLTYLLSNLGILLHHLPSRSTVYGSPSALLHIAPLLSFAPDVLHLEMMNLTEMYLNILRLLDCKKIVSCRGSDVAVAPLASPHLAGIYAEAFRLVDKVHCLGPWTQKLVVERYDCPPEKIVCIPPAVDVTRFAPKQHYSISETKVLATVGRLHWVKGHTIALQAIKLLVEQGVQVKYKIVGDGPERERLLFEIADLGLSEHVELIPWLAPEQVADFLRGIDIYLLPSLSEGFGNSVLEAMSTGNPVIVSDSGCADALRDGVEGYVVPRHSPEDLAQHIAYLCQNLALIEQMGRAARTRVERLHRIEDQIAAFLKLYEK